MSQAPSRQETPAPRTVALLLVVIAYLAAGIAALVTGILLGERHPVVVAVVADVAATAVVFLFSFGFRNSSFYDPYWSVAPVPIALYWALGPGSVDARLARQVLVVGLVAAWAVRLTHNWVRGWTGLAHEDWRYVEIRARTGRLYWPASLLGIHLVPTLVVFLGCLPLYPALSSGGRPVGWLDVAAAVVTGAGIGLEFFADNQLRRFRVSNPPRQVILDTGLWRYSRHPNYLGEMLFWWGLALFSLAAAGVVAWAWIGALAIAAMFRFASLPLIEARMLERHSGYADYQCRVPRVVPWSRAGGRPPH